MVEEDFVVVIVVVVLSKRVADGSTATGDPENKPFINEVILFLKLRLIGEVR